MARTIESEQWDVRQEMSIPYYEETQKRTFRQKMRKIKNLPDKTALAQMEEEE